MTRKTVTNLALVAGCALALAIPAAQAQMVDTQVLTTTPRVNAGDRADWLASRNNAESREYMRLLQTNRNFRQARIQKECGPITDMQLRQSCMASFDTYTPFTGGTRLAGNDWYPPNPQASTQPHLIEQGLTGSTTGTMGMGTTGGPMAGSTMYGAGVDATPHRAQTLAPVPGQGGPEPWYSSRNYPGQGTSVPPVGAAPTYPGPRVSGPLGGEGGGSAGGGGGTGGGAGGGAGGL
ncbi:MAG TPA: hypothetical protein VHG31_05330 [Stellaceae bacterium]|nr:hypothetical protein [Stellaceae bacterium]